MAKVKTVTKKLGANDPNPYFPEDTGVNYKIYAYKNGSEIHDASKDDYLIGGNGDDVLVTGLGNDTISGGKGDNTFIMHGGISGNDTVVLGKGTDHLIFAISDNFRYSKTGNDLIIDHNSETTEGGQITVKDYFKSKEGATSLKDLYGAGFENPEDLNTLINAQGLTFNDITDKTKKITGTYLSDVIIAEGDVKNTITTGKGDDKVTAGLGADTITIDGAGDKTVKIKKGDGNDTIVFKGEGLKANVTLAFDYDQDNPDFADYSYRKEGNNLCIDRIWQESEEVTTTETTTIKDYFKHNLDILISKDSNFVAEALTDDIGVVTVNGNPFKASTIVGTDFDDFINGGIKVDKITTGDGDDEIFALLGNDKITINGKGDKTIQIGRADGNDSILFDLDKVKVDEKINVNILLNSDFGDSPETTYSIAKNNQDLIITNKYETITVDVLDDPDWKGPKTYKGLTQKITVKNYFGNVDKINLYVDEDDVYSALLENKGEPTVKGTTITGTPFDDEIEGTDKAETIKALAGNDTIYASEGNDKIYGGDGDDTYVYENFKEERDDGKYYSHTIYNSNGTDRISFTDLSSDSAFFQTQPHLQMVNPYPGFNDQYGCTYVKKGNDLIIGGFESSDTNRITLKDYFKSEKGEFGVKYIDNGIDNEDYASINLADDMMIEHSYRTNSALSDHKSNKYTGTDYNDYIEGSYKQDTLKGGDGNDIVNGFNCVKGKDNLYGGTGNDIMCGNNAYMYGGTGNDTYMSASQDTYQGVNTVISDESGYDTVAMPIGQYMIYFDVTQKDGVVTSTGDMYIKDVTAERIPMEHDLGNVTATRITDQNEIVKIFKSDSGTVIKDGTTSEIIEHYDMGAYESGQKMRYSASYNQDKIDEIATSVAQTLNEMGYSSVSEAIKKCTDNDKLYALVSKFDNTLDWENVLHAYWITGSIYNNHPAWIEDYTTEEFRANYYGTMYADDGLVVDSRYVYDINKDLRYSIINDYGGTDELILDNDAAEYSFLFDVEIDEKGNLLNYSRDFYVKFAGEEANETGIVIHDGRQNQHAVEQIWCDGDCLFEYNQATIDAVRQNVAGWLFDNGYGSVQDVLHTNDAEIIESMMLQFADINNFE